MALRQAGLTSRKKPLYRQVWEGKLAEMFGLMRKIAANLQPHVDHDEYHQTIFAPTRAGMGAGPILPGVVDLARQPKR